MMRYIGQLDARLRSLRQTARHQQDIRDLTKLQPHLPARPLPGVGDKVLVRAAPGFAPRWLGPHEIILTSDTSRLCRHEWEGQMETLVTA
ncbi:hypothetical protein chiPu_0018402 [Chiloscyllium punctatum]|uniref:Murine leukemia virus integrase C-terminal domain-containing protein n=1 Tax=Chiloscyllium punctatum TaxID=137246 RepID=A0A401RMX4_CHIPU|nr:hypothetical protein [Chiloscyllium punctatum]